MRAFRRNEAANLRHYGDKRHLPHICGFARHVRACDNRNLVFAVIEQHVVRNKRSAVKHTLHHRVATLGNFDSVAHINDRAAIVVPCGNLRKGIEHIKCRNRVRRSLHSVHLRRNLSTHLLKEPRFEHQNFIVSTEHLFFKLLQLLRNVAFAVGKGLLTYVLRRNKVLV